MDLTKLKLNWLDLISVILYYAKKKEKKDEGRNQTKLNPKFRGPFVIAEILKRDDHDDMSTPISEDH